MLLITGAIWANESWGRPWGFDSKENRSIDRVADVCRVSAHENLKRLDGQEFGLFCDNWIFIIVIFTYLGVSYFAAGVAQLRIKVFPGKYFMNKKQYIIRNYRIDCRLGSRIYRSEFA